MDMRLRFPYGTRQSLEHNSDDTQNMTREQKHAGCMTSQMYSRQKVPSGTSCVYLFESHNFYWKNP